MEHEHNLLTSHAKISMLSTRKLGLLIIFPIFIESIFSTIHLTPRVEPWKDNYICDILRFWYVRILTGLIWMWYPRLWNCPHEIWKFNTGYYWFRIIKTMRICDTIIIILLSVRQHRYLGMCNISLCLCSENFKSRHSKHNEIIMCEKWSNIIPTVPTGAPFTNMV